jgi:hypothetical protein
VLGQIVSRSSQARQFPPGLIELHDRAYGRGRAMLTGQSG